jgi:hypothetical protein
MMFKLCSIVLAFVLIGCSPEQTEPKQTQGAMEHGSALMLRAEAANDQSVVPQTATSSSASSEPRARMVVKTADVFMEVVDLDETMKQVQKIAEVQNGFVVLSSFSSREQNQKAGNVSIRVPATKFDDALGKIRALASKMENENIRGNDVTEEFYDVAARLTNKEKAEKRLQEILKAAKNVREILEVEQSLTNTRQEIEQLTARKRYLSDQAALSTINVNAHEPYPIVIAGKDGFWAKIVRGFHRGVEGFGDTMSGIVSFFIAGIPAFVVIGAGLWFGYRFLKRRNVMSEA